MQLCLFQNDIDADTLNFGPDLKIYRIINIQHIDFDESKYVIIEFDETLDPPDSEPLVFGAIAGKTYAVFDNRVWTILTNSALSLVSMFVDIEVDGLAQTADWIRFISTTAEKDTSE